MRSPRALARRCFPAAEQWNGWEMPGKVKELWTRGLCKSSFLMMNKQLLPTLLPFSLQQMRIFFPKDTAFDLSTLSLCQHAPSAPARTLSTPGHAHAASPGAALCLQSRSSPPGCWWVCRTAQSHPSGRTDAAQAPGCSREQRPSPLGRAAPAQTAALTPGKDARPVLPG